MTMESPSAQLLEASVIDLNEGGSSPFVTMADSRLVSKRFDDMVESKMEGDSVQFAAYDAMEDKENMKQADNTTQKFAGLAEQQQPTTPPSQTPRKTDTAPMSEARRGSADSDIMPPPPSTRKSSQTPKKTPLRSSQSGANGRTPRPASSARRNYSFEAEVTKTTTTTINEETCGIDDTGFSIFSEMPELTTWAKIGQSPTKTSRTPGNATADATPRTARKRPSPSRSPSPTPRRQKAPGHGHAASHDGTTSFLIDFTQQMDGTRTSPTKTQPDLLQHLNSQRSPYKSSRTTYATPAKQSSIMNLLDFELPPAPTPRSVPTITVRELESLKSSYLSQISSLKATLNGREAEVESLKRAVGDAERRAVEAQESLREEKNKREWAEQDKAGWEKRGQEVEALLANVKQEILKSEADKEDVLRKVEECEKRADDAEQRAVKAEERFADALAARASSGDGDAAAMEEQVQRLVAAQIDSKIEAVSRELHSVYKEKHERKVGTLKKSYEARSEKKCAELQARLSEVEKQNEELIAAKDATFSGPVADATFSGEAEAELKAQLEEQRAHLARLESEMKTCRDHQSELEQQLEQERIEKGDLVAAVDEMLLLQSDTSSAKGMSVVEDFRKSISRPPSSMSAPKPPSGLPAPGGSKIGGLNRNGNGGGKGGMMSRIERMGRSGSASHE